MHSPFAAFLRVYEPLAAFDPKRAEYWQEYVEMGRVVPAEAGPATQRSVFYESMNAAWNDLPDVVEHAYVIEGEHGPLICPWQLRPRMADAVNGVSDLVPERLLDAFVPSGLTLAARRTGPGADSRGSPMSGPFWHERSALWHVPTPWFAFLEFSEREIQVTDSARALRYRLPMPRARRRARHAYGILQTSLGRANSVAVNVRELTEWLAVFHPRSVVELDYGGLTRVMTEAELRSDNSPEVAQDGLSALARGDFDAATRSYERLTGRWRSIRLRERRN